MTQWNLTHTSIHRYWINLLFLWSKGERCFYFLEQGVVIQSDSLSPTGVPVWMSARPLTWPASGHPRWMLHWSCMSTPCLENWPLLPLYFTLTKSISQRQFFPMKSSHVCKVCYRLIGYTYIYFVICTLNSAELCLPRHTCNVFVSFQYLILLVHLFEMCIFWLILL